MPQNEANDLADDGQLDDMFDLIERHFPGALTGNLKHNAAAVALLVVAINFTIDALPESYEVKAQIYKQVRLAIKQPTGEGNVSITQRQ